MSTAFTFYSAYNAWIVIICNSCIHSRWRSHVIATRNILLNTSTHVSGRWPTDVPARCSVDVRAIPRAFGRALSPHLPLFAATAAVAAGPIISAPTAEDYEIDFAGIIKNKESAALCAVSPMNFCHFLEIETQDPAYTLSLLVWEIFLDRINFGKFIGKKTTLNQDQLTARVKNFIYYYIAYIVYHV